MREKSYTKRELIDGRAISKRPSFGVFDYTYPGASVEERKEMEKKPQIA